MNLKGTRCMVAGEIAAGNELGTITIAREKHLRPSTVPVDPFWSSWPRRKSRSPRGSVRIGPIP
jgi:hypothetical protein